MEKKFRFNIHLIEKIIKEKFTIRLSYLDKNDERLFKISNKKSTATVFICKNHGEFDIFFIFLYI